MGFTGSTVACAAAPDQQDNVTITITVCTGDSDLLQKYEEDYQRARLLISAPDSHPLITIVATLRFEVQTRPKGHPHRSSFLYLLSRVLNTQFYRYSTLHDLEEAIDLMREAISLDSWCPTFHFGLKLALCALANQLRTHFETLRSLNSLIEAESLCREALNLCDESDYERGHVLTNLAEMMVSNAKTFGDTPKLEEAVALHREAVRILPSDHPHRGYVFNVSGVAWLAYYDQFMNRDDLDEAINLFQRGLSSLEPSHIIYLSLMHNLSVALMKRHMLTGCLEALAEAIRLDREVLRLEPPGNIDHGMNLGVLAGNLLVYFEHNGGLDVLEEAIDLLRQALVACLESDKDYPGGLVDLAHALQIRWRIEKDGKALLESIQLLRRAVELRPPGHTDHALLLGQLANAIQNHAHATKDSQAVREAIELHRKALKSVSPSNIERAKLLTFLADALHILFEQERDPEDLQEAIRLHREVCSLRPEGHALRYTTQYSLARLLLEEPEPGYFTEAMELLLLASADPAALPRKRVQKAIEALPWIERSLIHGASNSTSLSSIALDFYVQIIRLLPRIAHYGLDHPTRLQELNGSDTLCRTAAVHALLLGRHELAVEIIEKSKAVFWAQAMHARDPMLNSLPNSEREELVRLFYELENGGEASQDQASDRAVLERLIENRRRLNARIEAMIIDIRSRPGFSHFLDVLPFTQLAQVTTRGPVVFLLGNELACFALVLTAPLGGIKTIHLVDASLTSLQDLCIKASNAGLRGHSAQAIRGHTRLGLQNLRRANEEAQASLEVLRDLWQKVVQPVVQALELKPVRGRTRPRIHWCPSGDFASLPLHAAGVYTGPNTVCVADYLVSSYTPSISSLIKSRAEFAPVRRVDLNALLVSASHVPGHSPLPNATSEMRVISNFFPNAPSSEIPECDSPFELDVSTVLARLPSTHFLHLACHGLQQPSPLDSHFALRDGSLGISALMGLDLPNATFAFLSACETAKGDRALPDQAVHLAASLLFCGFRSVMGTMWSMGDADGPIMAQRVYQELLSKDEVELDDIPYAVDAAIQFLRARRVPPSRWATFIHVGA